MVEVSSVGDIAEQIKARMRQVEQELKHHADLADELARLRGALSRLEDGAGTRGRARRTRAKAAPRPGTAPTKKAAAKRSPGEQRRARGGAPRPRGETRATILQALADGPKTAGDIAAATGVNRGTASTTLSNLAKRGDVIKAKRGYRLPGRVVKATERPTK